MYRDAAAEYGEAAHAAADGSALDALVEEHSANQAPGQLWWQRVPESNIFGRKGCDLMQRLCVQV